MIRGAHCNALWNEIDLEQRRVRFSLFRADVAGDALILTVATANKMPADRPSRICRCVFFTPLRYHKSGKSDDTSVLTALMTTIERNDWSMVGKAVRPAIQPSTKMLPSRIFLWFLISRRAMLTNDGYNDVAVKESDTGVIGAGMSVNGTDGSSKSESSDKEPQEAKRSMNALMLGFILFFLTAGGPFGVEVRRGAEIQISDQCT